MSLRLSRNGLKDLKSSTIENHPGTTSNKIHKDSHTLGP